MATTTYNYISGNNLHEYGTIPWTYTYNTTTTAPYLTGTGTYSFSSPQREPTHLEWLNTEVEKVCKLGRR